MEMKKGVIQMSKSFLRFISAFVALILVTLVCPTTAFAAEDSAGRYYETYSRIDTAAWQNETVMVNFRVDDPEGWMDWLLGTSSRSTFVDKVEAAYRAAVTYAKFDYQAYEKEVTVNGRRKRVKNLSSEEMAKYLPQYDFETMFDTVTEAIGKYTQKKEEERQRPIWTQTDFDRYMDRPLLHEVNFAVLMKGLLLYQDVPAFIDVGESYKYGRRSYRVAAINTTTKQMFFCDPAMGVLTGNHTKWMWLSTTEYREGFEFIEVFDESGKDLGGVVSTVEEPNFSTEPIEIPAGDRFDDIKVPVIKNRERMMVPMQLVRRDNVSHIWIRDMAMILEGTDSEIWLDFDKTLYFGRGDYDPSGTEVNWLNGESIKINKDSQAYALSHVYYEGTRIPMEVIVIGDAVYVDPYEIIDRLGIKDLELDIDWI